MQPWNIRVKRIKRGYFFIALICCLALTGIGEIASIATPQSEKIVDVNGTAITTTVVNHEGRWLFFIILFAVLRTAYMSFKFEKSGRMISPLFYVCLAAHVTKG